MQTSVTPTPALRCVSRAWAEQVPCLCTAHALWQLSPRWPPQWRRPPRRRLLLGAIAARAPPSPAAAQARPSTRRELPESQPRRPPTRLHRPSPSKKICALRARRPPRVGAPGPGQGPAAPPPETIQAPVSPAPCVIKRQHTQRCIPGWSGRTCCRLRARQRRSLSRQHLSSRLGVGQASVEHHQDGKYGHRHSCTRCQSAGA